jgi:hypothetical protein
MAARRPFSARLGCPTSSQPVAPLRPAKEDLRLSRRLHGMPDSPRQPLERRQKLEIEFLRLRFQSTSASKAALVTKDTLTASSEQQGRPMVEGIRKAQRASIAEETWSS